MCSLRSEKVDYTQSLRNWPCLRLLHGNYDESASPGAIPSSTFTCDPSSTVKVIRSVDEAAEVVGQMQSAVDREPSEVDAAKVVGQMQSAVDHEPPEVEAAEVVGQPQSAVDEVEAAEVFEHSSSVKVIRTDNTGGKRKWHLATAGLLDVYVFLYIFLYLVCGGIQWPIVWNHILTTGQYC